MAAIDENSAPKTVSTWTPLEYANGSSLIKIRNGIAVEVLIGNGIGVRMKQTFWFVLIYSSDSFCNFFPQINVVSCLILWVTILIQVTS